MEAHRSHHLSGEHYCSHFPKNVQSISINKYRVALSQDKLAPVLLCLFCPVAKKETWALKIQFPLLIKDTRVVVLRAREKDICQGFKET